MELLSKDEEELKILSIFATKAAQILSFYDELVSFSFLFKSHLDILKERNELIDYFDKRVLYALYQIVYLILKYPQLERIKNYLDINDYFPLYSILVKLSLSKRYELRRNIKKVNDKYEEKVVFRGNSGYRISLRGDEIAFGNFFIPSKFTSLKEYRLYLEVMNKLHYYNCHEFNTRFCSLYPRGYIVTGNIKGIFNEIETAHTWIEEKGEVFVPNLNYHEEMDEYYTLMGVTETEKIPCVEIEEEYEKALIKKPNMNIYDFLRRKI